MMKANNTISASLKGMAKRTYNRVMSAMAEDNDRYMGHTFAALTDGAKAIALQSGKFSNLYIRGEHKGMAVEEAAKELTERAAACVSRKLRKIDTICAVAFLTEYISRQRKADETPETPNPENNTPATMKANDNEYLDRLRYELQEYHNNASKGGANRQRNMAMLAEDIARLEASANEITVTVHHVAPGHWQAFANGVKFGWVCTWDYGTFAACMNIGIREQKAFAPLDLWNEQRGTYGHKTESAAVASLSEMITSYFAKYGYTAKVLNA